MKKTFLIIFLIAVCFFLWPRNGRVLAEQSGSTPESGSTSRIKTLSDALATLSFGSTGAGAWGDWGTMWNRIYSSATWDATLGDAAAGDVTTGKKFYAGANRDLKTGTAAAPIDFSLQQYSARDDYAGPTDAQGAEDYQGEESVWTSPTTNVWKDTRTGVYWSSYQGDKTNSFTVMSLDTCDFFNTTPRKNYAGGDADCGVAINYCATLDFGNRTDWYLPTQKELMMAFIDGMYNQAGTTLANAAAFTTTNYFWSSSEVSDIAVGAWYADLYYGYTSGYNKTYTTAVRCVARD